MISTNFSLTQSSVPPSANHAPTTSSRPDSLTNTFAVIGELDLGVLIPVADYQLKSQRRASDPVVSLSVYEHILNPQNQFTLIFDPIDENIDLTNFVKWCLFKDNFMDMTDFLKTAKLISRENILAGRNHDIPVFRSVCEYGDLIVEQLFLTVGKNGYCILATYPKEEASEKSKYWGNFFQNILPYIERTQ